MDKRKVVQAIKKVAHDAASNTSNLEIKAINGLSDNGFSGLLIIKDKNGKVIKRKGFSGPTEAYVRKLANNWLKENT